MIIFQNEDDHQLFVHEQIISPEHPYAIVNGSGVHLERYPFRENSNTGKRIVFILVARLIREKGVQLYIDAAKRLKEKYPAAEFHIIGTAGTSPSSISTEELKQLHEKGTVVYHGRQSKVSDFLSRSDIFVLPTFYREGIPRSILEALSVGLPVITTNSPGCRETVKNAVNGFLVQPKDLEGLSDAMEYFLKNPSGIHQMGLESRKLAEEKFDVHLINEQLLKYISAAFRD